MTRHDCIRCGRRDLAFFDSLLCGDCEQALWDEEQALAAKAASIAEAELDAQASLLRDEQDDAAHRDLDNAATAIETEGLR